MNDPNFSFAPDPASRLLRIAMSGFWDSATVARYDGAAKEAGASLIAAGCPIGELLVLVDARQLGAQAQAAIADYQNRFTPPERHQPRRIATVVASTLFKRQVERIALPNQRIFEDEQDAMAWLRS